MSQNTTGRSRWRHVWLPGLVLAAACTGGAEYVQTTFHPVSDFGEVVNRVFFNTFAWTMGIMALVFALVLVVIVRFRERPGRAHPKQIHGNTALEITWTLIPALIVIMIAVPTVRTVFQIQRPAPPEALEIEVVGHQWWWEFRYPEAGIVTANQFYVPVGRPVHLRLSSADVVHSFWLPRWAGKRDVNPLPRATSGEAARANHLVFTVDSAGRYRGQCAEFCGESHAIMAMYGVAVPPAEYDAWVRAMTDTLAMNEGAALQEQAASDLSPELVARGRERFLGSTCIACHAIAGTPARGAVGPNLTRFATRPTVGAGAAPLTLENVERWIRRPQDLKPGALMPGANDAGGGFPPTGLTDDDIRAVAAYLMSLR